MAEVRRNGEDSAISDRSIAELVKRLSDQTATLVHQELDLAKAELTAKGARRRGWVPGCSVVPVSSGCMRSGR